MVRIVSAGLLVAIAFCLVTPAVFAAMPQDEPQKHANYGTFDEAKAKNNSYVAIAIGLGMGLAVIGGALGQGKGLAASVEAMARQPEAAPKIQTAMIIGLALIETLVIYMTLIGFMLLGNMAPIPGLPA